MSLNFLLYSIVIVTMWKVNNGFVLQHTHKNHLSSNGNEDFSVYLEISDEDYEMISEQELHKLNLHLEDEFDGFNGIPSKEYENDIISHCNAPEVNGEKPKLRITDVNTHTKDFDEDAAHDFATLPQVHMRHKREDLKMGVKNQHLTKNYTVSEEYSNSKLNNIYQAVKTGKYESGSRIPYYIKEIISFDMTNCTEEDASGIGLRALKCFMEDYKKGRQPYNILAIRLWNIAIIWLFVYLVVAIPLWCTRGWCCCCLCCKFFKPRDTIQEAKKYLLLNPPGTLITKRGGIIHYEPTEREKDCYEEFAHFIRTL